MYESYTRVAKDYVLDLVDQEVAAIYQDIESTPSDTPVTLWKKKLSQIAREFSLSSRFALMRILLCRANGISVMQNEEGGALLSSGDFEIILTEGKRYAFRDVSLGHAENLTPEENRQYVSCLMDIADLQSDSDQEVNAWVISRAWYDEESAKEAAGRGEWKTPGYAARNKKMHKTRLSRDEALQLGHILDFSLEEMQWFLLRTFDVGDSLRYNLSDDLIHIYGFLTGASWQHVQKLREQYANLSVDRKNSERSVNQYGWTKDISDTLPNKVTTWKRYPESMDANFLDWMKERAPYLNHPAKTAAVIYRNLAALAFALVSGEEPVPEEELFFDYFRNVYEKSVDSEASLRLFYQNGSLSQACCKAVADTLLLENKVQSASVQKDNTKAWHVLHMHNDGTVTASGGPVSSGRKRIQDILTEIQQAEKSDMLYLFWFASNLIWQLSDNPDANTLCCRIFDFMDTARELLSVAMLPEFYPPHPIEQSMLLSILSARTEDDTPSVVYEYLLHSLTKQRQRTQGSVRHDRTFKIEAVTYYRNHPEVTLEECAEKFGISPKTLSAWQKKLVEEDAI